MNIYTKDIAEYLDIDIKTAADVQNLMEENDFDFSEASTTQFRRAAKQAYEELLG